MERVLSYREADAVVRERAQRVLAGHRAVEQVGLTAALGRVLAEPVRADRDQPPFPRAARDGFALRSEDQAAPLRVLGQVRAGELWRGATLQPGEAVEIMTGAAVPVGADAVVMVEHVERSGDRVTVPSGREVAFGANVVPVGSEATAGSEVVAAGVRLGPTQVAMAAACGYATLAVFVRPRVAILATGDELVEVGATPRVEQIRNSNSYSLAAEIMAMGAEPVIRSIVPDELEATERAIRDALACDLVLLTGGVSMGKFDFVEQALSRLGAEFFFTGAKIQPGKPIVFGAISGGAIPGEMIPGGANSQASGPRYFFGLPGNPISTMVTFGLFVSPLLAALQGEAGGRWPRWTQGALTREVRVKPGLTRFLPARIEASVDGMRIEPIAWQGSGDLASAAQADGFVVVPMDTEPRAGATVAVLLIG